MSAFSDLGAYATLIYVVVGLVVLAVFLRVGNVVRYIPNDQVGVIEKLWSSRGSVTIGFIALNRQAGFQPEILRGGIHFFFPFAFRVHRKPLVTIAQGKLGYVFARDGAPLGSAQALAANAPDEDFQDVRRFPQTRAACMVGPRCSNHRDLPHRTSCPTPFSFSP